MHRALADEARAALPAILGVLALSVLVRLFRLGASELWLDEILVLWDAAAGTNEHISSAHRLHLGAVGFFLERFGESPTVLRLWGALTGSLAAPVVALAGAWLGGRRMALLWGGLVAVNPFLVFYSQDANYYGAMAFFAALQLAAFVAFFRGAALVALAVLLAAGAASYANHPFSLGLTLPALAICGVGLFAMPSLRRETMSLQPSEWKTRPALPILIAGALASLPFARRLGSDVATMLSQRLGSGEAPPGVELAFGFFNDAFAAWGVSYFGRETLAAQSLAWVAFVLFATGVVALLRHARVVRPAMPLALLALVVPVLCFVAVFHLRHHGFYPRYFTCFVPLYLGAAAWGCLALGDALAARAIALRGMRWAPVGLLLACQLPFLAWYSAAPRGNFAQLVEELRAEWQPGEAILVPHRNDWVQLAHYFPHGDGDPSWPEDFSVLHADERFPRTLPHVYRARLLEEPTAWIVSGWRTGGAGSVFDLLTANVPQAAAFRSPHGRAQDALLLRWQPTDEERAALRPPPAGRVGPFEQAAWLDDGRHREVVAEGTGLFERRFDGPVAHLVSVPDNGNGRQLHLHAMRRAEAELVLVVTVDGRFAGTWELPAGAPTLVRIPTDIRLEPGVRRVEVHGFTPRIGYTPENPWQWGGLELRAEAQPPAGRWDESGPHFLPLDDEALRWDRPGHASPREWALELDPAYALRVAEDVATPSGATTLEIRIEDAQPRTEVAYHALFPAWVPVPTGRPSMLAFSTHLRLEGTTSHAAALVVGFFDEEGNLLRREMGKQHLLVAPWSDGWRLFHEFAPVPAEIAGRPVAFAAPGVMVFPPDPAQAEARGRVLVDRFVEPVQLGANAEGSFRVLNEQGNLPN